jgi:hypothetical protein
MPKPTIDDVIEKIQATVAQLRQGDMKSVSMSPDTYLWGGPPGGASLDLDSLAVLELLVLLEEEHGLTMPDIDELDVIPGAAYTVRRLSELYVAHASPVS